jgi:AmmeMemoRadiSam system protein A
MPSLSEADRRALLGLARHAVVEAVSHGRLLEPIPNEGVFAGRQGVFVTLQVHHRLRGCIGVIEGDDSLGESTVRCAASAALQDHRFAPLRTEDLGDLRIEISLLSPPALIRLEQIEIGRHGLLISHGQQRGLLLPQVATEHHLAPEQFLQEACHKAQLPREAWREAETQVFGFTCEVFSDEGNAAAHD